MATITATPKKFSMQQVFEILLRKPADKSILAYLEDVKTSGLENTVEMTYPTGGRGNTYIGGGFSHSKKATLNVTMATWNTEVLAIQNGTEVSTGAQDIVEYEVIEHVSSGSYTLTHKAEGATGAEIGFVYAVNEDGTYGKKYTQASSAASGSFAYNSTSKTITFATGDAPTGDIALSYTRKTTDIAQKITIDTEAIPATVLVTAYGLAKDVCSGELFPCQVDGMAQIDGNYNFDLSADGEPAVHSLNMEFVKACRGKKLYDFVVYTDDVSA
jgi:hypothetical protein